MNKAYLYFFVVLSLSVFVFSLSTFFIVGLFVRLDEMHLFFRVEISIYIVVIVVSVVAITNLKWFLLDLDNIGIKYLFKKRILWSDLKSLKVSGFGNFYKTKVISFTTKDNKKIEVKLFVFKDPMYVCEFIKNRLDWLSEVEFSKNNIELSKSKGQSL